ncbi:pre-B-cell leukemia homeobox interacting protein 1b isoform X2 [Astatotilapia calliptera]|uniref:Pre-B-cell leukemia homeobox interacting protein 1b n=1 Tax=Astatotilapia calliptera TaxID=8154 RepID=A0AAX7SEY3_ASTCA|nr:pre-B-cell leukemia transcription factor-interacting protein 1-like isoform X2 [Astatotilapia calliptera]
MSGTGSANNSWTILTPEETAAETLKPVIMGTEYHGESHTTAPGSGDNNQPANGAKSAEGLPVENYLVPKEKTAELSGGLSADQPTSVPTSVTDNPIPSSLEVSSNLNHGSDEVSQAGGLPEGPAQSSSDPDSYSDSYTHVAPSPDEPPLLPLSTETLGGAECVQMEGTQHLRNEEELKQEGEESDAYLKTTDLGKETDPHADSEVSQERTEKAGEEGESEVRKRRSLLASLEQIGRREEEEEVDEFQLPQREDDSGFSVNKCILGALILLGLGTIFFSGIFMDLDEESDYSTRDLKDTELPGKREWLNPEAPQSPLDADNSELLNKLAKGNEQISVLQAQLQTQNEELKVAQGHAAEGAKERLRWEAVEKENSRLKTEMASLPVLQKENERMKKELESFPALQKELETLRSTVTELKVSSGSQTTQASMKLATLPPPGQPEDSKQETAGSTGRQTKHPRDDPKQKKKDVKRDRYDLGEQKEGKERKKSVGMEGEKKGRKDGSKKEWKKEKHEQGMSDRENDKEGRLKRHSEGEKQWKEKDWKKEKTSRGDEGKPWKDGEGKRERTEKREKKEWNEDVDRKRPKHEKVNEGKQLGGKEENKHWKEGKDRGGRQKEQKEWKKLKDGFKESGKVQWEDKEWKEKGEREWRRGTERDDKNDKLQGKVGKEKDERKRWEGSKNHGKDGSREDDRKRWNEHERKSQNGKHDKEWKSKDKKWEQSKREQSKERDGRKEKKHNEDWKKDKLQFQKSKDVYKVKNNHGKKEEHQYGDQKQPHTHRKPSMGQPEYWVQQRERLQHSPKPSQECDSLESCAKAERLLPVHLPEFEAILQTYLAKAEQAGVDDSKREELKKLATQFFKDGVFVHDQMSFQDFVEDLSDILEDMVEEDEDGEQDSAIEDEMEEFEREVMRKFSLRGGGEKEERIKGDWRKESGQGRG